MILLLVFCILIFIFLFLRKKTLTVKMISATILVILVVFIILFGHSKLNYKIQATHDLTNLNNSTVLSFKSDKKSTQEIIKSNHPLKITFLSIKSDKSDKTNPIKNNVVKINGDIYKVDFACHNTPLSWTPFETWDLNSIKKETSN
jgi:uncharacterized membrane protein